MARVVAAARLSAQRRRNHDVSGAHLLWTSECAATMGGPKTNLTKQGSSKRRLGLSIGDSMLLYGNDSVSMTPCFSMAMLFARSLYWRLHVSLSLGLCVFISPSLHVPPICKLYPHCADPAHVSPTRSRSRWFIGLPLLRSPHSHTRA